MIFECIHDSEETARVWLTDLCFKLFLDKNINKKWSLTEEEDLSGFDFTRFIVQIISDLVLLL